MTTPDPTDWVGRSRTETDPMSPWAANALVATLGLDRPAFAPGDALPPFWHWMYFLEARPRTELGPDGHPATGGFMPAVRQPRRMWAGGRVEFHAPMPLGAPATRRSTIAQVAEKTGRAGEMTFVTVRHEIGGSGGPAIVEEQDIVYRFDPEPGAKPPAPKAAPTDETARREWSMGPVELFRYSALTFNGHRIHYDLRHATETEGYPGLVVHGPLLATLLLDLAGDMAGGAHRIRRFDFRALAPVFAGETFTACGREAPEGADLWIRGNDGRLTMTASVDL
ncbi:MaoC family dehydratase N-terminal domain-containing protein [Limibaculum sp. M0105]|uniref:MaoC family dehydratase N-terminal domain-containing protein n=1 Tax=Thermohalobaculum xanthum TaxID=2753746 RepID=A0A8J7M827_9RHOB|nr:MaoC family dehydratase N-terminal domain-containing protein [Thermohalobaculum xanthum]MBK0399279.1 MaoC family dehydratase N-terminal domain-containing protein [Thermohalobaculum xanthum]